MIYPVYFNRGGETCSDALSAPIDLCLECPEIIDNQPGYDLMSRFAQVEYLLKDKIDAYVNKAVTSIVYGLNDDSINVLSEINTLYLLLFLIYKRRLNDYVNDGAENTVAFYREYYNLECIENNFDCYGIDIREAMDVFNIAIESSGIDWGSITLAYCIN